METLNGWPRLGRCVWLRAPVVLMLTLLTLMMGGLGRAVAHEIPADVQLVSMTRIQGTQWVLMIRAPMAAMTEADIPLRGPYLDMARVQPALEVAARLWFVDRIRVRVDDRMLPPAKLTHVRVSLASDRSFESWDRAQQHLVNDPPETAGDLVWKQQFLDARLVVELPSAQSRIEVDFGAERMGGRVTHTLHHQVETGPGRVLQLHGATGFVSLDPGALESVRRFAWDGLVHILSGLDHLLFLACLLMGATGLRSLAWTVTGFTLAHSLTLAGAVLGVFPDRLWWEPTVEWTIAASIVVAAADAVLWPRRSTRLWMACGFGLVHGVGFSFALREALPFAGDHAVLALASFNLGVEAGQLLVLVLAWPVWRWITERASEDLVRTALGLVIAHTAWHWMAERWGAVDKFLQTVDPGRVVQGLVESPVTWGLMAMAAAWWLVSLKGRS